MALSSMITSRKWSEVLIMIQSYPDELMFWIPGNISYRCSCQYTSTPSDTNRACLPIHLVCGMNDVPVDIVEMLIVVYPQSLKWGDRTLGYLPLHWAVSNVGAPSNVDVINLLLNYYKKATSVKNIFLQTPLSSHLFCSRSPSLVVVKLLVKAYPDAVQANDRFAAYALHYASRRGDWKISEYLVSFYPEALRQKDSADMSPLDRAQDKRTFFLRDKLRELEERHLGCCS